MMSEALGVYLHDHLAGAAYAIDLVEFMSEKHRDEELRRFAAGVAAEIKQDRETLRQVAERVGSAGTSMKEVGSWLAEKLGRIKLGHDRGDGLATFEALEFLVVGIHGKWVLWRALERIAPADERLAEWDFVKLAERAQEQRDRVDARRLELEGFALRAGAEA
jgi:hypothetical protein